MSRTPRSSPYRIAIDARKLGDYGIGDYLWNLVDQLHRIDSDTQYVILHQSPPPGPLARPAQWVHDGSGKYSIREQLSLPWHAWREGVDLLHCPHYVVPLVRPCKLVVTIHDIIHLVLGHYWSWPARQYARFMLGQAVRAEGIITVSEGAKRDIVERLGVSSDRITVIHNGVSEAFHPVSDPRALEAMRARYQLVAPYLLCVGNPRMRHKNLVTAVRAFRLLVERGEQEATLVIAGGPPSREVIEALRAEAGAARDRLRFPGFVRDEDMPALFTAAAAFVWPSLYEGFGIPPVQAMACGTPVVSSNASVMPEILGDAAVLVQALEVDAYATALRRVLDDSAWRNELAARGFARAARYRWADHAERTLRVYRDVTEGR
ncbi:MAG TPA: glycosyltransferase family 1 protein [bacterium]